MSEQLSPYEFVSVITDVAVGKCKIQVLDQPEEMFSSASLSEHREKIEGVDTYDFTEEGKMVFEEDGGDTITISFVDEQGWSLQKYPLIQDMWPFTNDNE